ncbi:hypothetical protein [Chryseobacterium sp. ISL-6]|uniref:hypothetical protein n=1 Tax=Chryseobacterium sp. ISL-6 TaxID=2819143 RepID=UPI001BE832AD|nr:hypothetical protein [Chryseobacterium sp. ISL-6]MBT2621294.1 hypothetical protein [Chryseobacterium sp. ISL-6]
MKNFILIVMLSFFVSCHKDKRVRSEKGGIDVVTNIYYNASKGLDDHQQIVISRINYWEQDIIELVPNINIPEIIDSIFYIKDSVYFNAGNQTEAKALIFKEKQLYEIPKNLYHKKSGAIWVNIPIYGYNKRKNLTDTLLYGRKQFKRFQVFTPENYSIFYIAKTDTILPYSLNPIADCDYGGRLERIDSYDKKRDLFTTVVLLPRRNLDKEAEEIFEYNHAVDRIYVNPRQNEK